MYFGSVTACVIITGFIIVVRAADLAVGGLYVRGRQDPAICARMREYTCMLKCGVWWIVVVGGSGSSSSSSSSSW